MGTIRDLLDKYTSYQCPVTGPGIRALENLLTAIVDRLEEDSELKKDVLESFDPNPRG